ncbi:hypothetical protein PO909_020899 [Leuciscus waleckii]
MGYKVDMFRSQDVRRAVMVAAKELTAHQQECISLYLACNAGAGQSYFSLRKPSAAKVARVIGQEGWTTNCPKPDDIAKLWRSSSKQRVETDPFIQIIRRCVAEQTWTGLAIKDFGPPKGFGVVAT